MTIASSLLRAVSASVLDAARTSDVRIHAQAFADSEGLRMPARLRSLPAATLVDARLALIDTAHAFTARPTLSTYTRFLRALLTLDGRALSITDTLPARLMSNAPACDPPVPPVREVPPGMLDWQTHPAIGCNPLHVAMLNEGQRRTPRATPAKRARKPAKPRKVKPAPVSPTPRALPPMGRPILHLPRASARFLASP